MQDKNLIIKHRGVSFYFLGLVAVIMFLLTIGTILTIFNTNEPFFILGTVLFGYITYVLLWYMLTPEIVLSKESFRIRCYKPLIERILFPKGYKIKINLKDINKIIIATGRHLNKSVKFKTDDFVKEEINKMKKLGIFPYPIWLASQFQLQMYIVTNTNKKHLVNIDFFTKEDILELLNAFEEFGIKIEKTVN
jgi:hypothetical protein